MTPETGIRAGRLPADVAIQDSTVWVVSGRDNRVVAIDAAHPEEGGTLVVLPSVRSNVSLRAFGGGVAYQVSAERIGVDNGRPAGRYQLEVPRGLERLTVLIGKQVVFSSPGGRTGRVGRDTIPLSIDRVQR